MATQKARIRLSALDVGELEAVCNKIKDISRDTGVKISGPVPLPTKKLPITVRKSPGGQGTATFEHYQMRIHKRLIDIYADDRTMRAIMRIRLPEQINIEIELLK
ncbi:30S ribosomal protein S10 [Candidatus Bathyarchaeota archaeon]|nr:30S ribosomal protein S10 [Candidatus Bathyarchaeota archaeon]